MIGGCGGSGTNRFTNNNTDYASHNKNTMDENNPMAMNYADSMTENGTKTTMGEYLKAQNEAGGDYVRQKMAKDIENKAKNEAGNYAAYQYWAGKNPEEARNLERSSPSYTPSGQRITQSTSAAKTST